MASSGLGEPSPPLQHQTCELKVSIHCEGCKKKVRRILRNIQGVLDTQITQIDSKQHKVVVTGTVPAEALIKKLIKSGKNAELWPEKKDISINTSSSNKNKDTSVTEETTKKPPAPTSGDKALKDDKVLVPATKTEAPKISTEPAAESAEATESSEVSENSDTEAKESNIVAELTKPAANDPKVAVSAPSKISSNENSKIGDKEKKIMDGGDDNKKKHGPDEHPIQHQPQPVPVYAYSVAQPSMSYSHYAQPHEYYSYPGHHSPPPVSYYSPYSSYPPPEPYQDPSSSSSSQQPGSYDMFNDENANSCNVM